MGERITFEGYGNEPDAQLNAKKNIFGKLAPDLLTNAGKLLSITFLSLFGPFVGPTMPSIRGGLECRCQQRLIGCTTRRKFLCLNETHACCGSSWSRYNPVLPLSRFGHVLTVSVCGVLNLSVLCREGGKL